MSRSWEWQQQMSVVSWQKRKGVTNVTHLCLVPEGKKTLREEFGVADVG